MRLKGRISLFFFLVIVLGASSTLFLVRSSTESMFRSFVYSGDAGKAKVYATILADWYAQRRSWAGVEAFLMGIPGDVSTLLDTRIHGSEVRGPRYSTEAIKALVADRIAVADAQGVIVADTSGALLDTVHPEIHLAHGIPINVDFARVGTVLVGSMVDSSLSGVGEIFLASVTRSLVLATLASAGLALLLGLLLASRLTRPLGELSRAARRVAAGDLGLAVPVVGKDELADLSLSFNEMTGELRRLEAAKRQVIADAAHELRTPVTLIQGTLEAMLDGVFPLDRQGLSSVHEETLRLARLIETLRELELIESGELELSLEDLDLGSLLSKAAALFASTALAKDQAIHLEPRPGAPFLVRGDPLRLEEVVYNLVGNALRHSPQGAQVRLRVETEGGQGFSVDDSGPGIAPAERARVLERFYRLDASRSRVSGGRGLGLSIASEIVKAHGGSLTIGDSDLGGASFRVYLPSWPVPG